MPRWEQLLLLKLKKKVKKVIRGEGSHWLSGESGFRWGRGQKQGGQWGAVVAQPRRGGGRTDCGNHAGGETEQTARDSGWS